MKDYSQNICTACETSDAWPTEKIKTEMTSIPLWVFDEEKKLIYREISFSDFKTSFSFAEKIKDLAEQAGHHPTLHISWGKLRIELWTHSSGGVTENDFILASSINKLLV